MPQFTYDPNNPNAVVADVATGGDVFGQKRETPAPSSGSASTATAPTPAPKKKKKKKKKPEKPTTPAYNPFTAPFKTPSELRAEAARLAALGSTSEEALRAQQAQEEAGLAGLTGGLATALRGVSEAQTAGLAGLGSLYQQLGGAAQSAAQSAAAAAGAPTSIAPGTTPTAIASFLPTAAGPGLGAVVRAYESVAPVIGAQLVGASRANLAKALTQRAGQISSDTAKYLRQMQQEEVERGLAQATAQQNLARLGLSERELGLKAQDVAFGQQIDLAKLNLAQQKLAAQIAKDNRSIGKDRRKKVQSAQQKILNNVETWTTGETGEREYEISFLDEMGAPKSVTSYGRTSQEAVDRVKNSIPSNRLSANQYDVLPGSMVEGRLGTAAVLAKVVPVLVNAGMTRANARRWVINNLLNTSGAFMGGVA